MNMKSSHHINSLRRCHWITQYTSGSPAVGQPAAVNTGPHLTVPHLTKQPLQLALLCQLPGRPTLQLQVQPAAEHQAFTCKTAGCRQEDIADFRLQRCSSACSAIKGALQCCCSHQSVANRAAGAGWNFAGLHQGVLLDPSAPPVNLHILFLTCCPKWPSLGPVTESPVQLSLCLQCHQQPAKHL